MDHIFYITAIFGITQVFKMADIFPARYSGLFALGIGVAVGIILSLDNGYAPHHILMGIMYGLSASGAWSTPKNALENPPTTTL